MLSKIEFGCLPTGLSAKLGKNTQYNEKTGSQLPGRFVKVYSQDLKC